MKDSKLILLLKSLDTSEFKGLRQFLQSPYYNRNQQVSGLYDYLAGYYPAFSSPRIQKEAVYNKLFPGRPFDLNRMRKLMTALTQLLEAYLAALELEQALVQKKKLLAAAYGRRNLVAYFEKETRSLISGLQAAPNRNRAYYYEQWLLNLELFSHPGTDHQSAGRELLEQAMEHLDYFYLLSKLQLAAEMRTRENILAEKYSIRLQDEVVLESRQSFAAENPLCQIYLQIIELHQDAAHNVSMAPTLALFKKIFPELSLAERQTILHHLINHCIRLINRGEALYRQELFNLYQLGIEHHLLLANNRITEIAFSNIVAVGASLKDFNWTRYFIDNYARYLNEDIREDIIALSLALLHFNQKAYDQTEHALLGHKFSDMLNLLKSRSLLIRTYFEQFLLNDINYSFLNDQFDAFEKFIRRHKKIAKDKRTAYLNFVKFTKKLAHKRYNKEGSSDLQRQISAQEPLSYKEWLLEKLEER